MKTFILFERQLDVGDEVVLTMDRYRIWQDLSGIKVRTTCRSEDQKTFATEALSLLSVTFPAQEMSLLFWQICGTIEEEIW